MDVDEKELQLFLEIDDMEMQEVSLTGQRQDAADVQPRVGRGRSKKGYKRDYAPYDASDIFNRVKFFVHSRCVIRLVLYLCGCRFGIDPRFGMHIVCSALWIF